AARPEDEAQLGMQAAAAEVVEAGPAADGPTLVHPVPEGAGRGGRIHRRGARRQQGGLRWWFLGVPALACAGPAPPHATAPSPAHTPQPRAIANKARPRKFRGMRSSPVASCTPAKLSPAFLSSHLSGAAIPSIGTS